MSVPTLSETYVIGIDYGTESGRAVLVRTSDGAELAGAVHPYSHGVLDKVLPGGDVELAPDWALQHPQDWIDVLREAVPAVLAEAGVDPSRVVGIATDFTACTMLPTDSLGEPLCLKGPFRNRPHAWPKLWKHHAAQPHANRINELAAERGEGWLPRYGGKISSEWFFPKALQILDEAPDIYASADRLIEAADWIVWRLTGVETRNVCTAGYKAIHQDGHFPDRSFFAALQPDFGDVVDAKMKRELAELGSVAGTLTPEAAEWTGLNEGTAVAVGNVDAHVTVPAAGSVEAGVFVMIMGTSTCDVMVGEKLHGVEGMCGVVQGGIVPGRYGYEAGQSAVGDIFAWYLDQGVPKIWHDRASREGTSLHELLEREAARQRPGSHGLLALDWLNGNRSVLVDADLSGLLVGLTLSTTPPDIYRALLESTAFGTRVIVESFDAAGIPVSRIVAAGGLPAKNELLMQITADVLKLDIHVLRSTQGPAVGSAMHAAVAAGVYPDIAAAATRMGGLSDLVYRPSREAAGVYDELYREYLMLHDLFGRSGPDEPGGVMKRLRALRARQRQSEVAA